MAYSRFSAREHEPELFSNAKCHPERGQHWEDVCHVEGCLCAHLVPSTAATAAVSMRRVYHEGSGFGGSMRHFPMNEKPNRLYRVFAPGVPNVRVMSERLSEADARSRKREILMAYPAASVRIEKIDEAGRAK